MKLKVQIIENIDQYARELQKYNEDPDIYGKPEPTIGYLEVHIPVDIIDGFKIDKSENNLVITTAKEDYVVDYNEELYEELKELINILDSKFYKQPM